MLVVDEQVVDKPRHFASFDGLRAIAALLVLLLHTAWVSGFTQRSSLGIYLGRLEIGVSIFFLISGFLLYRPFALSHLAGLPEPDRRRFWTRRLLRIVPAYWLALTVLTYGFHSVALGPGWQGFVSHYFFLQIYFPAQSVNGIPQAWSLCTEVSFYLFLPLYAWLMVRRPRTPSRQLRGGTPRAAGPIRSELRLPVLGPSHPARRCETRPPRPSVCPELRHRTTTVDPHVLMASLLPRPFCARHAVGPPECLVHRARVRTRLAEPPVGARGPAGGERWWSTGWCHGW